MGIDSQLRCGARVRIGLFDGTRAADSAAARKAAFLILLCVAPLGGWLADAQFGWAQSAAEAVESEILFVRRVAPVLREKCLGCHGSNPDEIEGSLDLRSLASLLAGGDSGQPAMVVAKPELSPLYQAATRESDEWSAMPPKDAERLTAQQLQWLSAWIASGGLWPSVERQAEISKEYTNIWSAEDGITVATSGGLDSDWTHRKYDPAGLWAFQPVVKQSVEALPHAAQAAVTSAALNEIDAWIAHDLPSGLSLAPRAERRELIRRTSFDLTGLPPSVEQVEAYINDPRSDQQVQAEFIERMLASPHYGERMAQHWLDVTRYADSSGFANDYERGNAWRYRDYVIRSFNQDKPYDQFVREQIAGDEFDPDNPEMLVAIGFLRMGPWELTGMEVPKIARQRFLDDVTNSVGETFLGQSLQCARCHDHKFDPIPTRDYYSIQAVFATTQLAERRAAFLDVENTSGFEEQRYLIKRRRAYEEQLAKLDQILLANARNWYTERGLDPAAWNKAVAQSEQSKDSGIFNAARSLMMKSKTPEDQFPPKLVGFTPQQFGLERVARKGIERLKWELERYQAFALSVYNGHTRSVNSVNSPTRIPAQRMQGELEQSCILSGGDPFAAADPVTPGTLSMVGEIAERTIPTTVDGRRSAFADWVVDPRNPLTSRVMVNRLWQWHFGTALAGNPNNFGSTGKRPTHPELLDWLAATFVEGGWSIKDMHRQIMNSNAYCRSTNHPDPAQLRQHDPLLSSCAVFQPRRLSAEELRDAMLAISGELNPSLGGIPCRPEINLEVALQPRQVMGTFAAAWIPNPRPEDRHRRSIYILRLRGLMEPMLEVFNAPTPDFSCERRDSSTVTPQVFTLLNSHNTYARSLALANRTLQTSSDDRQALESCVQAVLNRPPSNEELNMLLEHWSRLESCIDDTPGGSVAQPLSVVREAVEENTGEKFIFEEELTSNAEYVPDLSPADVDPHVRALADLCLVLFNSNEFVYVY